MYERTTTLNVLDGATAPSSDRVAVLGPASLSNLGPGFDTLGLCISGVGDVVEAWLTEAPGVQVVIGKGKVDAPIPTDPARNTAARAAASVMEKAKASKGVVLRIQKGIPLGSGIGGSAASAVAGAWAANVLLDHPFTKEALVEAVLDGETVASGAAHGDNVLPALLGGLVLTSPADPKDYRRIELPRAMPIAVLLPHIKILTHEARAILPNKVPFKHAVHNASDLAFLLEAFRVGDWATVGRYMMRDRLVEPVRARLVPCYEAVRAAALEAGAYGCALTGSGPALFAVTETANGAAEVFAAMHAACLKTGIEADGGVTETDLDGVRVLQNDYCTAFSLL